MKAKNIILITILPLVTLLLMSATTITTNNEIKTELISNAEFEALGNEVQNEPIIFINKDFNSKLTNRLNSKGVVEILENGEENEVFNVDLELASSYNFNYQGTTYRGKIYANPNDSLEFAIKAADEVINQIYEGTFFQNHNSLARVQENFEIDDNWLLLDEEKVDYVCTYDNEHFGDFSEWRSIYKLKDVRKGSSYYAFVNESYITPEKKDTDYRTDDIIYKYDPTLGASAEVRNYAPKMKSPSAEISYSISAGTEAKNSGGATISSSIGTSYLTLIESPKIYDQGNMSQNYVEIKFDYLKPFDNKGDFYEYNISQTYQSSSYILKTNDGYDDIITRNDRTLSIQRDGFWSNRLVHFNMNSIITIVR